MTTTMQMKKSVLWAILIALSLSCSSLRLLTPGSASPEPTATPSESNPPEQGIIGRWFFTVYGEPWENAGVNHFYAVFREDGTLIHKYSETGEETFGHWTLAENVLHFDINQYSYWDGIVEGDRMTGSVYNNGGDTGTWSAEYRP